MTALIILTSFNTLILVSFSVLLGFVLYLKVRKNGTNKKTCLAIKGERLRRKEERSYNNNAR